MALAIAAFTFTGCESIPMPYEEPTVNDGPSGGDDPISGALGTGTETDPFNVAGIISYTSALAADVNSEEVVYFKGIVESFKEGEEPGNTYGNATFYIVDEGGSNKFYCFRVMGPGNQKFTSADQLKIGDEVVVCGNVVNYKGNTPETVSGKAYVVSVNGEGGNGGDGPTGDAKGAGTETDPYNVPGIIGYTSGLAADVNSDKDVYFKGIVDSFKSGEEPGNTYGNATFYIKEQGGTDTFYCFRVMAGPNNKKFTSTDELKVGDEVVICGTVVNYKGNTPETASGKAYVYSINGKKTEGGEGGGNAGGGTGSTGTEMTAALINSGQVGDVALGTNGYGSQVAATESTWYTWKFNDITYKGARICNATSANGSGIQVQGNDSDAAKQGFIFNADAYAKDIKNVVLVARVVNTSTYDPNFSFYVGTAAHPTSEAQTLTPSKTADGNFNVYTYTFDLSAGSYKYFTIANDKTGALYIDKIVVTLKD